jgi:hypothetical protein
MKSCDKTQDVILLGQGNYNTLGVLHQLSRIGICPLILSVGKAKDISKGNIIGFSKYAHRIIEVTSEGEAVEWIKKNAERFSFGTRIYPTSDTAEKLLDCNFDELIKKFKFPNAGRQGAVAALMDKHYQTELAKQCSLRVLDSQYSNTNDFSFSKVSYPCMIKPLNSTAGSKGDMCVCNNLEELQKAITGAHDTKDFIVQQYIHNEADILCLGVSFEDGDVWLPAVVVKPGVSAVGEYTHAIISTDVRKYLPEYETIKSFVKGLKYIGPFSIEFGREKGLNYFFEINLRNDGTSHYPLNANVNIASAYIDGTYAKSLPTIEYNMIDEVGDLRRVLSREISLFDWIKIFHSAGSYRFYESKDYGLILPLLRMFMTRTISKLCRML